MTKIKGRRTIIVVRREARIAKVTSSADCIVFSLDKPYSFSLLLKIFSETTILESRSIPAPKHNPARVILFKEILEKYIKIKAKNIEKGRLKEMISIMENLLCKKKKSTRIAKTPPIKREYFSFLIAFFINSP